VFRNGYHFMTCKPIRDSKLENFGVFLEDQSVTSNAMFRWIH